jgi:hypothetical protein
LSFGQSLTNIILFLDGCGGAKVSKASMWGANKMAQNPIGGRFLICQPLLQPSPASVVASLLDILHALDSKQFSKTLEI